jgi:hypothetical protein
VRHVGQQVGDKEANLRLADTAGGKLFALDGENFVGRAMIEVKYAVDAGVRHRLSRFVRAMFAIYGSLHTNLQLAEEALLHRIAGSTGPHGKTDKGWFSRRLPFAFGIDLRGHNLDIFQRDVLYPEHNLLRR